LAIYAHYLDACANELRYDQSTDASLALLTGVALKGSIGSAYTIILGFPCLLLIMLKPQLMKNQSLVTLILVLLQHRGH
jgi:hypothetical protein